MKKPTEILSEFQRKLKTLPDAKSRIHETVYFAQIYGDCYGEQIVPFLETSIEESRRINYAAGESMCYCNLAFFSRVNNKDALGKYGKGMKELEEMVERTKGDKVWYPMGLNMIGYFYWFKGEYEKAFNILFKSCKIVEDTRSEGEAWNFYALAVFYFDTKDFENSRLYYQRSLDIFKTLQHEYGIARAANGLGTVAIVQNKINEALPLLGEAAHTFRKLGHYAGLSRAVNDMGVLEKSNGNYRKAVEYLQESIELRREIEHLHGLATSYTELGETYHLMGDHHMAQKQLTMGLKLSEDLRSKQKQMRLHKLFYDSYKVQANTELALKNIERFYEIKSELLSDESANSIKKIHTMTGAIYSRYNG